MKTLGERLREMRENAGYKQWQVSEQLGLAKNSYGSYEINNSTPSVERLVALAELYHTTVQYIITGKELSADIWSEETTPFPQRLKELRTQNGLTQDATAKTIGVGLKNYQKYEYKVCTPKLDKLLKLAELFDVTLDELMGRNRK